MESRIIGVLMLFAIILLPIIATIPEPTETVTQTEPVVLEETIVETAPPPEHRFFYSSDIRVVVTKEEKQKVDSLLALYEDEIVMMSKVIYKEARRDCIPLHEKAAVAWVILNRFDSENREAFGGRIDGIITKESQFAWNPSAPHEDWYWLAKDVMTRWLLENEGFERVGRVLPHEYLFFAGWSDNHNHFRTGRRTKDYWDWSLPNPYEELEDM